MNADRISPEYSVEVMCPGSDQKSYLPLGASFKLVNAYGGEPVDKPLALDEGILVVDKLHT